MKRYIDNFLQNLTFDRQLHILVTFGLVLLALVSSLVGSWLSNERVYANLVEQGLRTTEWLADQSELALFTSIPDNAKHAAQVTMNFPSVVGVEIHDTEHRHLLILGDFMQVGFGDDEEKIAKWKEGEGVIADENLVAWRFMAPVYSHTQEVIPSMDQSSGREMLGYVSIVMSKNELVQTTRDIFIANMATSIAFALLVLFLLRFLTNRMTKPLNQLSLSMGRAKEGESEVRAELGGPRDISDMARAFNSMMAVMEEREEALRISAIAFEVEQGMIVTDSNGRIIRVNNVFSKISGYRGAEVIGEPLSKFKSDSHDDAFYQHMQEALRTENHWQGEIWNIRKNGEIYPEWLTVNAVIGREGDISNYICGFIDITERKKAEEKIHQLAFFDPLCQLPNRRLLFDRLHHAVASSARNSSCAAVLFIDLDNFKMLNDTRGHDMGDLLLVEVGQRLKSCIRETDTLARLGGDEFVVLLEGLSEDRSDAAVEAREVAEKIIAEIHHPYSLKELEHYTTTSIGISLLCSEYNQNLDDLLKQADTAMYAAKKGGRNTLRFFDPKMQDALEIRSQFETSLRKALPRNEFVLFYQVQVDSNSVPVGAEVLLRWEHPERGRVSPDVFIPIAEDTGLIVPLGRWVLEMACDQLKKWQADSRTKGLELAVNVSGRQFRQADFVQLIQEVIEKSGINPALLKLEMTESTVLENVGDTIQKMHELKKLGVRFSMDDFGTGYSSLAYLTRLPLDQLKIDQSFVQNIFKKSTDAAIIKTIIGMSTSLGFEVIAEGVETVAQRDFLLHAGCKIYQGYLFGRPVPVEEYLSVLESNQAKHP